jgi:hypothetical protein
MPAETVDIADSLMMRAIQNKTNALERPRRLNYFSRAVFGGRHFQRGERTG